MSISRVKVGQPISGSRSATRNGFKWSGQARSSNSHSGSRLRLNREVKTNGRTMGFSGQVREPRPLPDLVDGPLPFLTARQFCVLILVTMTAIMLVWGMISSNHKAVAYSYDISKLTKRKTELLEMNRNQNAELASLAALSQLEKVARENLGLKTPQQGQIVVIDQ